MYILQGLDVVSVKALENWSAEPSVSDVVDAVVDSLEQLGSDSYKERVEEILYSIGDGGIAGTKLMLETLFTQSNE
ncbi:hypothetical protein BWQ96_03047 [Gracilariopsis chorda]|uniref:Uncharacterized protein n=1 Tax=Gracilariopsis chorda TaxID=448386 RepID=A0A2V3IYG1_9FLOR|nr:hypothetical protein BWQ96_03047 [Gracilariopsis chorda]|eukprot:PXF47105.1 hypothetical protein BWQ96_03047 [Gracilariopsis chorda]